MSGCFEGPLDDVGHVVGEVDGEVRSDGLGHVVEVGLVAGREDDLA